MNSNAAIAAAHDADVGHTANNLYVTSSANGAVCWAAIFAGAAPAAALSLIMLILGTGLGLSSVSPWAFSGASASAHP